MFKLAKASGVRVPDLVNDVGTALALSAYTNGSLVNIDGTSGLLTLAVAADAVAGIIVSEAGSSSYAAPAGETYTSTLKTNDNITFLPVTGTLLIEADYTGTFAVAMTGDEFGLGDETEIDLTDTTNKDFRVVGTVKNAAGVVTKLKGFFVNPGYFTS